MAGSRKGTQALHKRGRVSRIRNLSEGQEQIPEGTRGPLKDLKVKMAHCQAQAIARKYGWAIAMTREDLGCAISGHTYGWEQADKAGAISSSQK